MTATIATAATDTDNGQASTDDAVGSIHLEYDSRGLVSKVWQNDTTHSALGDALDQVTYFYDDYGMLVKILQKVDGDSASDTDGYIVAYTNGRAVPSSGDFVGRQSIRRTAMTLPGATSGSPAPHNASAVIEFNYGTLGNLNDLVGRVEAVDMTGDGTIAAATYSYLGASQLVGTMLEEPEITNRLFSTGPDKTDVYKLSASGAGMDRFNRVLESRWGRNIGSGTRPAYAYWNTIRYDAGSNILSTVDHLRKDQDVLYTNDGLHRLIDAQEGRANDAVVPTGIESGTQTFKQAWGLSHTGNWLTFDETEGDGSPTHVETRTNTAVNEIETRTVNGGGATSFVYNAAGQLTDDGEKVYTYDAFGRLRYVHARGTSGARGKKLEESRYNGLGHRIAFRLDTDVDGDVDEVSSTDNVWVDQVYDDSWRVVATFARLDVGGGDAADQPRERFVYHAAGMDGRGSSSYIDDVILREREDGTSWTVSSTASLTNRLYYLQNWRHDVVALVTPACGIVERTRYTSYGMPSTMTGGDFDHNLVVDDDDFLLFQVPYNNVEAVDYSASTDRTAEFSEYDLDVDGEVGDGDFGVLAVAYDRLNCALPGELSHRDATAASDIGSRIGYAGYLWSSNTVTYKVRHRVYDPVMGSWMTRDPQYHYSLTNLYEYSWNSPLAYVDNDGQFPIPITPLIPLLPFWTPAADACGTEALNNPKTAGQGCDSYEFCYKYVGSNAQCFCRCAGNSPWSNYVRSCLQCLYAKGVSGNAAHAVCYAQATAIFGPKSVPNFTLAACYAVCTRYQQKACNDPCTPGTLLP